MEDGDFTMEAALEATQGLGCQVDFGDQHQSLLARQQDFGDSLQVDFGLAAAGFPLQQVAVEAIQAQAVHHPLLLGAQLESGFCQQSCLCGRGALVERFDQPLFLQGADNLAADTLRSDGGGGQVGIGHQQLQQLLLFFCPGQGGWWQAQPVAGQAPVFTGPGLE